MKNLVILLFLTISFNGISQERNNDKLNVDFGYKITQVAYSNEAEMVAHLKNHKSQTYKYYIKLNSSAKNKVYQNHVKNSNKSITNIILELYLAKS